MKCATYLVCWLATAGLATSALSDVDVSIGIEGYNDFFKRCDLKVEADATGDIAEASVFYRVLADGVGGAMCEKFSNGSACRSSDDFKPKCEQITRVNVVHAKCSDADGKIIGCGAVTTKPGAGMSAPVGQMDIPTAVDGTLIFASLLGGPDYSDRCSVGMVYAAAPEIRQVKVSYEVPIGGDAARCTLNMGGSMGTGLSCLGADDYTCDAVTTVNIKEITCETDEDVTDCGPISLHGATPGLLVDDR